MSSLNIRSKTWGRCNSHSTCPLHSPAQKLSTNTFQTLNLMSRVFFTSGEGASPDVPPHIRCTSENINNNCLAYILEETCISALVKVLFYAMINQNDVDIVDGRM